MNDNMTHLILTAIQEMERHAGKATTPNLANELYVSQAQMRRYLTQLEENGIVIRIGERGGWKQAA